HFCGAAAAMMILERLGQTGQRQDVLYESNHDNNRKASWFTDPFGMSATLRNSTNGTGRTFNAHLPTSEPAGTAAIVDSLWNRNLPAAALVFKYQHWLVVADVETSVDPRSGDPYDLLLLSIRNPFWLKRTIAHQPQDECRSFDPADEVISYSTWIRDYFTGAAFDSPVVNGREPALQFISVREAAAPTVRAPKRPTEPAAPLASVQESARLAAARFRELRPQDERTAKAFGNRTEWRAPVQIERLDRPGTWDYLNFFEGDGVGGVLALRGSNHAFRSVQFDGHETLRLLTDNGDLARQTVVERGEDLLRARRQLSSFARDAQRTPNLVWRPCRQSLSPALPFHEFKKGRQRYYVRIDGEVFDQLTHHEMGL
ncbi:MAG TPA: hypothetical protein VEG34_16865, partial [Thermoanaerobaculia bacterium]|nr:hypothetical protein [Thermoanaerobaculia bacterium]